MDNEQTKTILQDKLEDYKYDSNYNLSVPYELKVQITLAEYRHLVEEVAKADVKLQKENDARRKAEILANELQKENILLKNQLLAHVSDLRKEDDQEDVDE